MRSENNGVACERFRLHASRLRTTRTEKLYELQARARHEHQHEQCTPSAGSAGIHTQIVIEHFFVADEFLCPARKKHDRFGRTDLFCSFLRFAYAKTEEKMNLFALTPTRAINSRNPSFVVPELELREWIHQFIPARCSSMKRQLVTRPCIRTDTHR